MYEIQTDLFHDIFAIIDACPFYKKYYALFSCLDLSDFPDKNYNVGCTGYSRHAMLRALIVKWLQQYKTIPSLLEELDSRPVLVQLCKFENGNLPDATVFYRFLSETKNSLLQKLHEKLNKALLELGIISLGEFAVDSKPVLAPTRENNPKNPGRNTTNKKKKPKRNPSATLCYYSYQTVDGKKGNYIFFWGYRTHVIVSAEGSNIF